MVLMIDIQISFFYNSRGSIVFSNIIIMNDKVKT